MNNLKSEGGRGKSIEFFACKVKLLSTWKTMLLTVRYFIYLIVTTKEKPVVDTQKIKRWKSKHMATKKSWS